jgi:hypothetical protein
LPHPALRSIYGTWHAVAFLSAHHDAETLGWPEQIVDATRAQLQSITKMQIQMMDQMMDAWEEQIRSPAPMTVPSAILSGPKSSPSVSAAGSWPNADAFPIV